MRLLSLTTLLAALAFTARAELKLPAIIGDNTFVPICSFANLSDSHGNL